MKLFKAWIGLGCLIISAGAATLEDVRISGNEGGLFLELSFGADSKSELPRFFQKYYGNGKLYSISFLETGTALPMERHVRVEGNPAISEVMLKQRKSPQGNSFLSLFLKGPGVPASDDLQVGKKGENTLTVKLAPGKQPGSRWAWSDVKPQVDKAPAAAVVQKSQPPEVRKAQAGGGESASPSASLQDAKWVASAAQEELALLFPGGNDIAFHVDKKGPKQFQIQVPASGWAMKKDSYQLPSESVFEKVERVKGDGLNVLVTLRQEKPVKIIPKPGRLSLASGGVPGSGKAARWSASGGMVQALGASTEDETTSAHDIGAKIDAGSNQVTSHTTFTPGTGGKPVWITRASVNLRAGPGTGHGMAGTALRGTRLMKVGNDGQWYQLVFEADTVYARQDMVVFEDELTVEDLQQLRQVAEQRQMQAEAVAEAPVAAQQFEAEAEPEPKGPSGEDLLREQERQALLAKREEERQLRERLEAERERLRRQEELNRRLDEERRAEEERARRIKEARERVTYNSFGRKDPFIPVEEGNDEQGINIDQMRLVGVIWDSRQPLGVLEHTKEANLSYTVKVGDPVHNGYVSRILKDRVTFSITEYGISRSFSLRLVDPSERGKK